MHNLINMAVEQNSDRDLTLKKVYFPTGADLQRDRQVRANQVFKPDQVKQWLKTGVNKSDLDGFDTPDAREPSQRQVTSRLHRQGIVNYVESEPERFLHPRHETRKLLDGVKNEMTDYESFKRAVNKAWGSDKSLSHLVKNMTEADYKALFETDTIKKWVESNGSDFIITGIMQRFNVERERATAIYGKMPEQSRQRFASSLLRGNRVTLRHAAEPSTEGRALPPTLAQGIRQRRGNTEYTRSKMAKWSMLQVQFLQNNKQLPRKSLYNLYNATFPEKRTQGSINNKVKRISHSR